MLLSALKAIRKNMSHQDWTPVVFNKKSNDGKDTGKPSSSSSSSSLSNVGVYKAASDGLKKK